MSKYNPFNPNSVVVPNLFAGRADQVDSICGKLSQLKHNRPSSFFIYGVRGIGKTALAKLIRYMSTAKNDMFHKLNLLTSYYSVETGQTIGSVLQESLNKLTDEMELDMISELSKRVGALMKNGKFQIGAFGASFELSSNQSEKIQEITIKDQTVSILGNIIKSLRNINDSKDGILIIIDEIHNLRDLSNAASIFRNIITTLDVEGRGKVSFLLIGYEDDTEIFFSKDTSARRIFDMIKLDVMPDKDAADILRKGFDDAKLKWNEPLLSKNVPVAGGYPYSVQEIGHCLLEVDKDGNIDAEDWQKAILSTALTLQKKGFSSMYSFNKSLTEQDQILAALAESNKPMTKSELTNKTSIKYVPQYIPRLKDKGAIIEEKDRTYRLQSQLFRVAILVDLFLRKDDSSKDQMPLLYTK